MKSATLTFIAVTVACAVITLPTQLSAQLPRYKVIDLGTLGGSNTFIDCCGVQPVLNNQGTMVGGSETLMPNPNANFILECGGLLGSPPDPFINPAFRWERGTIKSLGALPGGYSSFAAFVSDSGLIVGTSETGVPDQLLGGPQCHPTLWAKGGVIDLGTLGGYEGVALESNNRGQVVGVATNQVPDSFLGLNAPVVPAFLQFGTQQRAFLWDGVIRDLGTLGGPDAAAALINDQGQIAGVSYTNSVVNANGIPTQHPFFWDRDTMVDIMGTQGGTFGFPNDLNSRGQVVGEMNLIGDQQHHPFLWHAGVLTDLKTLGGDNGHAVAINNAGEVVGAADVTGSVAHHAFLWKNGVMTDLGTLSPCLNSTALSINSRDQVVGTTGNCPGDGNPFLSQDGQPMVDLTTLLLPGSDLAITDASFINERGEIACQGFDPGGNLHACLLVPGSEAEIAAAGAFAVAKTAPTASYRFARPVHSAFNRHSALR